MLNVRDFQIKNDRHLSKAYIQSFSAIFSKLSNKILYDVENDNKKILILAEDKKIFYRQIKKINLLREKGNTYKTIIKNL